MNSRRKPTHMRSMLFSPGNLEISRKLAHCGADLNVICLEDAVPPAAKRAARDFTIQTLSLLRAAGAGPTFVRVNAPGSPWIADDIAAVVKSEADGIVVPKLSAPTEVTSIEALAGPLPVVWGFESGWGVERVGQCLDASDNAVGIYFGSEDFATDVGLVRTTGGGEIAYARSRLALSAANRKLLAADKGYGEIRDNEGFIADAQQGRQFGYTGKICLTPTQARLANEVFVPTATEIQRSVRLLTEYAAAVAAGRGAPEIDGEMVDGPLVVRARKILAAAGLTASDPLGPLPG